MNQDMQSFKSDTICQEDFYCSLLSSGNCAVNMEEPQCENLQAGLDAEAVRNLKQLWSSNRPKKVPTAVKVTTLLKELHACVTSLCSTKGRNLRSRMCEFNGHVPTLTTGETVTKCRDCGQPIADLKAVRVTNTSLLQSANKYWVDESLKRDRKSKNSIVLGKKGHTFN